jgi:hypothetical protein
LPCNRGKVFFLQTRKSVLVIRGAQDLGYFHRLRQRTVSATAAG